MKISEVSFTADVLTVTWQDGSASRFHGMWLRDNAQGSDYRHPDNDQRLFDLTEVPADSHIADAALRDGQVQVHFQPEKIAVGYPASYLHQYAYDRPDGSDQQVWGAALSDSLTRHSYEQVLADPAARLHWLEDAVDKGIALLTGVPCEPGQVMKTAEIFGFVRETNYGRLFEVRSEPNPVNLAFTPVGLNVHTDNPYRDPVPGLQLLHCLVNDAEGGQSVFVDGFRTATLLRQEDPEAFRLLSTYSLPFRYREPGTDLQSRKRLIEVDDRGRITAVRYNNRSAAPMDLPFDVAGDFYRAYRKFADLLHQEDGELRLKLMPGELVLFDNERALHGRTGFSGGARHLQGCYADKDALRSMRCVLTNEMREAAE